MKRVLFYGVLSLLTCLGAAQAEDPIAQIRVWYDEIEGDKNLKKQTLTDGSGDEPGQFKITRYTSAKGELKKIHRYAGGEHGVGNESYYFRNGDLFFVYIATEYWRFTGEQGADGQDEVIDIASQQRLYFKAGECIKSLEKRIAVKGADELRQLLAKAPNKEKAIDAKSHSYVNRAKQLAAIRTQQDLSDYLSRP